MEKVNYKAVLFDLDGTLLDSESFYFKAWQSLLQDYGISITADSWMTDFAGKTDMQAYDYLKAHYALAIDEDEFHRHKDAQVAIFAQQEVIPLMPGARELLNYLAERQVEMALVTSSERTVAVHHLGQHQLLDYFSVLVSRTDVRHTKPHPEPYLSALDQLKVAPSVSFVLEDSVTGATAAKAAGLTCFGVQQHPAIRKALTVDRLFDDLHEVLSFINR